MTTLAVLGAGGGIGSIAARAAALAGGFDRLLLADQAAATATAEAIQLTDGPDVDVVNLDVDDSRQLQALLGRSDVVLNCIGPFYRFGPPILAAAIEAGVDYVDVCDDLAPTRTMLGLDDRARSAGVRALIGCGNSPGLANMFVRLAADYLLDEVHAVDIMHIHGGEPVEGPAVVKHRIHAMTNPVPIFDDGRFSDVWMLEESGNAYVREIDFRDVGRYPVYPYPHPETITIPQHIAGVRRVTNRGVVFPLDYFELTIDVVRRGFDDIDVAVAEILAARPRLLEEAGVSGPAGCLRVDIEGTKHGREEGYVFSLSSTSAGAGEGTGIPAGLAASMMCTGAITRTGVYPPEAGLDVGALMALAGSVVSSFGVGGGGLPLHVARVRDGQVDEVTIPW